MTECNGNVVADSNERTFHYQFFNYQPPLQFAADLQSVLAWLIVLVLQPA